MCAYVPCAVDVILLYVFGSLSLDARRRRERERERAVCASCPLVYLSHVLRCTFIGPYPCVLRVVALLPNT